MNAGARRQIVIRAIMLGVIAASVAWALVHRADFDIAAIETWVQSYGLCAPLVFASLYAFATVLFLPGSVLTIAGGALFGPLWGTFYSLIGATIGATIAFLVARFLASEWIARMARGRMKQLIDGVEREGWRFVAFTRLVPLFPFNLLNYALGLTRIPLSHYVLVSFVCMLPAGLAYAYLGYAGREAAAGSERAAEAGLIAIALLAAVVFVPRFARRLRKKSQ